jgi:hypothetical protein
MNIRHVLWVSLIALTAVITCTVASAQPSLPTQRGGPAQPRLPAYPQKHPHAR